MLFCLTTQILIFLNQKFSFEAENPSNPREVQVGKNFGGIFL